MKKRASATAISSRAELNRESSLSAIGLFEGLSDSCLAALESDSPVADFRSGHIFFRPGEAGHTLFILEKGSVQTYRTSGEKKLIIADLKPSAIFGEMGCFGPRLYHCFAETTEPSRIRMIAQSHVQTLLQEHPQLARRFLDLVSQRFVNVLLDLEATSFRQLIPRLANLLLERADGEFVQNVTHKELAQHLRVHRESATAALGELKKAGIIEVKRKQIRILDQARLQRASQE